MCREETRLSGVEAMKPFLMVAAGGMFGSMARYGLALICIRCCPSAVFPIATFATNCIGCLLMGAAFSIFERASIPNSDVRLFVMTGVLGGFTTFSAFGLETLLLLRTNEVAVAILYATASTTLCLLAVWAGMMFARYVV